MCVYRVGICMLYRATGDHHKAPPPETVTTISLQHTSTCRQSTGKMEKDK